MRPFLIIFFLLVINLTGAFVLNFFMNKVDEKISEACLHETDEFCDKMFRLLERIEQLDIEKEIVAEILTEVRYNRAKDRIIGFTDNVNDAFDKLGKTIKSTSGKVRKQIKTKIRQFANVI